MIEVSNHYKTVMKVGVDTKFGVDYIPCITPTEVPMSNAIRLAIIDAIVDHNGLPTHFDIYKALCRAAVVEPSTSASRTVVAEINQLVKDGHLIEITAPDGERLLDLPA